MKEKEKTIETKDKEIDELKKKDEANQIDLEANQLEIEMLKDEKEDLFNQLTNNEELTEDDILDKISNDELKKQNRTLRIAVTNLTSSFTKEREKLQQQIENGEGKKMIIAEYEKKLEDLDLLLEELDRKEDEIAELKMENEACLEYETMVEEMAHEILRREEKCEQLEKKVKGLHHLITLHEEYSENLEQYNEEIHLEIAEKDAEISQKEQLR